MSIIIIILVAWLGELSFLSFMIIMIFCTSVLALMDSTHLDKTIRWYERFLTWHRRDMGQGEIRLWLLTLVGLMVGLMVGIIALLKK